MYRILLADDDVELCRLLTEYLTAENFDVDSAYDGETALEQALTGNYHIIVLDIMMPRLNGLEVLKKMQGKVDTPVIMLTARGDDIDRIVGLEMGADDYLPKPCNPRELVARLRALLRRVEKSLKPEKESKKAVGDLTISLTQRTVLLERQSVNLTSTEFNVLQALLNHAGEVVDKQKLTQESLLRKLTPHDRSIDMHLSRIRKKLGNYPDGGQRIKTIRGIGYIYVVQGLAAEG